MYRKVIIVVFATFVLAKANPAPKIESSLLDNLLQAEGTGRSEASLEETIKNYIKSQDLTLNLPVIGSVTLDSKKLDNDEIDLKLNWGGEVQARKKSKLKKIFIPILVFILLKAMTLIPLALGILAIKTWNAIQLSFVSFVAALGMAVWKLCGKIAHDTAPQIIHEHAPWHHDVVHDHHARAKRSVEQQMAYSAYPQGQ
ncbi:uncharacterized protein LOC109598915 [Aethina tumida]|uniref:uncharacterized protein LOC109598915 n=1 Tax=Aethina tumida TaxID=116153 RepID=UPI00096B35E7|nr:uncharacterized protein LOC109598915 [Aethina tumida]